MTRAFSVGNTYNTSGIYRAGRHDAGLVYVFTDFFTIGIQARREHTMRWHYGDSYVPFRITLFAGVGESERLYF
jgi:hypothetical protein